MKIHFATLILCLLSCGASAHEATAHPIVVLPDTKGVVSWKLLAKVQPKLVQNKLVVEFDKSVSDMNTRTVKLRGYMFRLGAEMGQKRFLLSALEPSCTDCLPAGAEGLVDVRSATPIPFTEKPITIEGKFIVSSSNPMGGYYAMQSATLSR